MKRGEGQILLFFALLTLGCGKTATTGGAACADCAGTPTPTPTPGPTEFRGLGFVYVNAGDLFYYEYGSPPKTVQLTATAETESYPAWAPDGKALYFTRNDNPDTEKGNIYRLTGTNPHLATWTQEKVWGDNNGYEAYLATSPDGKRLLYTVSGYLYSLDLTAGSGTSASLLADAAYRPFASEDPGTVYFLRDVADPTYLDSGVSQELTSTYVKTGPNTETAANLENDGLSDILLSVIRISSTEDRLLMMQLKPGNPNLTKLVLRSRDGTIVTTVSAEASDGDAKTSAGKIALVKRGRVHVANLDGTETKAVSSEPRRRDVRPSISLDGSTVAFLVFQSPAGNRAEIWSVNADGTAQAKIVDSVDRFNKMQWRPPFIAEGGS